MLDGYVEVLTVAASGTNSGEFGGQGYRLVGLILPTLDSTVINFEVEGPDDTWTIVDINTHATAVANLNLGNANTGAIAQAVPADVGRLAAVAKMRLKVASQTGGARTIRALMQKE